MVGLILQLQSVDLARDLKDEELLSKALSNLGKLRADKEAYSAVRQR